MLAQARRALDHLSANYLSTRANAHWVMGYAHFVRKDYAAARQAFSDGIALGQAGNAIFSTLLATTGLGNVQEVDNQLHPGCRDFSASPAMGRRSAAADRLRRAPGPGATELRVERPRRRADAWRTKPAPGAPVRSRD
ncbi:MAG: hypothetical protein RMN52_06370 [Anaerolineae bacterium]|nr:hypothetical protein [Anaerolineae bacterium]